VQVEGEHRPVTTATAANTGTIDIDAAGENGSAREPNHWSVATPMPSRVNIASIAPVTSSPHDRRRQQPTAAVASSGSQIARSCT
jgi:hypothetical protein